MSLLDKSIWTLLYVSKMEWHELIKLYIFFFFIKLCFLWDNTGHCLSFIVTTNRLLWLLTTTINTINIQQSLNEMGFLAANPLCHLYLMERFLVERNHRCSQKTKPLQAKSWSSASTPHRSLHLFGRTCRAAAATQPDTAQVLLLILLLELEFCC